MENQNNNFRQYDIDWIRIFLIFSVFLFHIGMVFNGWGWHVKESQTQEWLHPIMSFLHKWRMPLLFLVSGVGTRYALGHRTIGGFVKERHRRLMLPLVAGIFILVPVQVYIEKINDYSSLGSFYLHMFDGVYPTGNFSWHHLWFLVYLIFISMVFVPFIRFFRSKYYAGFENAMEKFCRIPGASILFAIPVIVAHLILLPYFPNETHALVNDWASVAVDFLYFFYGFVLIGNPKIVESIVRDRFIALGIALLATIIMYNRQEILPGVEEWKSYVQSSQLMSWSLGLTIIGFARKYFNREHRWRRPLNQAIYPIYLLHQPIIVVVAYFVVSTNWAIGIKALVILAASVFLVWFIYKYLILPFNLCRLLFGLKPKRKQEAPKIKPAYLPVKN